MVGLLSGMDNEGQPSVSQQADKDAEAVHEESNVHKDADDVQPVDGNTDNPEEVEHEKELKSILKRRGVYTFPLRKFRVDFDLTPTKIPYNEDDYTVEIQIIEKEPVRIKSWAAIFAAKKAEAEAEAAAEAEAEEALRKAEEQQKREASKKANRAKLKQSKENSESIEETSNSPIEQNEQIPGLSDLSQLEPEPSRSSPDDSIPSSEANANQETSDELHDHEETNHNTEQTKIAGCIINEVLDTIIIPEEVEPSSEQKEGEGSTSSESLVAETSENLQEEHTNDDLEDVSTHDEASISLLEDSNKEVSSNYNVCHSHESHTGSNSDGKSSSDDTSVSHSEDNSSKIILSEDSSLVELQGKQVPKKVLVSAASLVEEVLSEIPEVVQPEPQESRHSTFITPLNDNKIGINKSPQKEAQKLLDTNHEKHLKSKTRDINLESSAQQKRNEFKKSNDSRILDHVKRSLESAAPEILETAVGVLEDIEKIVVDRVGSAIS